VPPALFSFERVVVTGEGGVTILHGVDLEVSSEGVTVLAGASGAGKSTLLRLCNRLEVPSSGRVLYRGNDVAQLDPLTHRREVGMVFQRPTLFPGTVRDNLEVALPGGGGDRFLAALDRADLGAGFLDRRGDELSGGEAQRACLARTLVTEPAVLLMDEVTSSLDPTSTRVLEGLACKLAADDVPVLWVTHDLQQMRRVATTEVVLVSGRLADPAERAAFFDDRPGPGA